MATTHDLQSSERAMQMICAATCSGRSESEKMARIERIVDAWAFAPRTLTNHAMVEDLPPAMSTVYLHKDHPPS